MVALARAAEIKTKTCENLKIEKQKIVMMDEKCYRKLTEAFFFKLQKALDDLHTGDVDYDREGDVLTVVFKSGEKCVLNTQSSQRQLWLATRTKAWHFDYVVEYGIWRDEKNTKIDLFSLLIDLVRTETGLFLHFHE